MASLMFISFDDLMMDFAKDHDIHKWEIIVASHEICSSLTLKTSYSGVSSGIQYESKYDNIEFVDSIRPTPSVMEYAYGRERQTFVEMYQSHLLSADPYMDICCIVDMVANDNCDVMIVMSGYECAAHIQEVLRDFISEEFSVNGFCYSDMKRLSDYYGTSNYQKIVDTSNFSVPEEFTGRNFEVIMNIPDEDLEEIRKVLEAQKVVAASLIADPGTENDLTSIFFNKFTESLEDKIREVLEHKDISLIKELCRKKSIRIQPGSSKEFLIDKLMHDMRKTSVREYEYTEVD